MAEQNVANHVIMGGSMEELELEEAFWGPADINGGKDGQDDVSIGSSSFDPYECSENEETMRICRNCGSSSKN